MPGNPTVIPGIYRADLSGLTTLGQALGEFFTRDRRQIEEAMELINDPVFMEQTALGYENALERDKIRQSENLTDFANQMADAGAPTPSAVTQFMNARMLAAGLDPTNQKHVAAAMPVLRSAHKALSAGQIAQARLAAREDFVTKTTKASERATDLALAQTEAGISEQQFVGGLWRLRTEQGVGAAMINNELLRLNDENYWLELSNRMRGQAEKFANEHPALGALAGESREGFREGLLTLLQLEARAKLGGKGMDAKDITALLTWRTEELRMARQLVFQAPDYKTARAAADDYNSIVNETRWLFEAYGFPGRTAPVELDVRRKKNFFGRETNEPLITAISTTPTTEGDRTQRALGNDWIQFKAQLAEDLAGGESFESLDAGLARSLEAGEFPLFDEYSYAQVEEFWQNIALEGFVLPKFRAALAERYGIGKKPEAYRLGQGTGEAGGGAPYWPGGSIRTPGE